MKTIRAIYFLLSIILFSSNLLAQDYKIANYCFSGSNASSNLFSNISINASVGSAFVGLAKSQKTIVHVNSSARNYEKSSSSTLTDVKNNIPVQYSLEQNYPNPFNPSTKIKYSIPKEGYVVLSIFNILGARVMVLVNEMKTAGSYEVTWNASDCASGIYVCWLSSGSFSSSKKMMLLK